MRRPRRPSCLRYRREGPDGTESDGTGEDEQTKAKDDEINEDGIVHHQQVSNVLLSCYPLSTLSVPTLSDDKLEIDFTETKIVSSEPTSCRFNIDLRIDTDNKLIKSGELLSFRRNYKNPALC